MSKPTEDNSKSGKNGNNQSSGENIKRKLQILCLHGYRQDAETFRSKCGALRKMTKNYADYTFITAPHQAPRLPETPEDEDIIYQKSWWFNKDDGTFKGTNVGGPALGFEESLKFVEEIWNEQGPFDGILGFSQGACFTTIICALAAKQLTIIQPKFVVLISGFESGSLVHKGIYETELPGIKSLHVFGENDEIIPSGMSKKLLNFLPNARIVIHSGGHYIPAAASHKADYIAFMENMQFHCSSSEIIKKDTKDLKDEQKKQQSLDETEPFDQN